VFIVFAVFESLNSLFRVWSSQEGESPQRASSKLIFRLLYGDLIIGHLVRDDDGWTFYYDAEFREQKDIQPLADFPEMDRMYKSKELWPFFAARIPGLEQPAIRSTLIRENINPDDDARLLQRFGARSIANPFFLQAEGTETVSSP